MNNICKVFKRLAKLSELPRFRLINFWGEFIITNWGQKILIFSDRGKYSLYESAEIKPRPRVTSEPILEKRALKDPTIVLYPINSRPFYLLIILGRNCCNCFRSFV